MKKTLLGMTRDILNDLDADEVNSIDDTTEAQQVANIIKQCYEEMVTNRNWPHTRKLIQLEASGSLDRPNYLRLPDRLKELEDFRYDKRTQTDTKVRLQPVKYLEPDEFLRVIANRNSDNTNVSQIQDFSGSTLLIYNDKPPQYWTSFDDTYLVTDAYDSAVDDTLKSSKTQCLAYIDPEWVHEDDAIPDLPTDAFAALQEEAKSVAFVTLKQMANQKAEQKSQRQNRWLSRKAWRASGGVRYENYGRKGRK